jgi:Zn-dependent peptidase ImmA (M78 family)/DNA-binding XRE family transcriptional regulator
MLAIRLKQLRLARGLSLDALAERIGGAVTKQALSKYEKGASRPSMSVLAKLAEALGVKTAYLFSAPKVKVELLAYRKCSTLLKRDQAAVESLVSLELEDRLRLQELTRGFALLEIPCRQFPVRSFADAEQAAIELRRQWNLGEAPIASLVGLLEDRMIHVLEIEAPSEKFDAISAVATDEEGQLQAAAVVTRLGVPGERQRLNLAHELGHLVMECAGSLDEEKAAYRFAGAFLVPETLLRLEVGSHRSSIPVRELLILKKRFGVSMQALLYRLRDLGIINQSTYKWACIQINRQGWRKKEPEALLREEPQWLTQNVLRAVAEGLLTREEAERLGGEILENEPPEFMDRRAFMKLPISQRRKILLEQAAQIKSVYERNPDIQDLGGGDFDAD